MAVEDSAACAAASTLALALAAADAFFRFAELFLDFPFFEVGEEPPMPPFSAVTSAPAVADAFGSVLPPVEPVPVVAVEAEEKPFSSERTVTSVSEGVESAGAAGGGDCASVCGAGALITVLPLLADGVERARVVGEGSRGTKAPPLPSERTLLLCPFA